MIRRATLSDLPDLRRVYDAAKVYMDANGNPTQWTGGYPTDDMLRADIAGGWLYVLARAGGGPADIYGAFALVGGEEPFYARIDGPGWRSEAPYGTIHRIGSDGSRKGVFAEALAFARGLYDHLRVDTHADNRTMQHAVLKHGFYYCGIVDYGPAGLRLAYEWTRQAEPISLTRKGECLC